MKFKLPDTIRRTAFVVASTQIVPNRHRSRILHQLGLVHGKDALIGAGVTFLRPDLVYLGPGVFINAGVHFDAGPVTLERNVFVGPRAIFLCGNHGIGPRAHRAGDGTPLPVHIGEGSWIGAGAIVFPGVTIGPGCIIGAGAVVTSDCEPDGVYVGVPARRVRTLPEDPSASKVNSGAKELDHD